MKGIGGEYQVETARLDFVVFKRGANDLCIGECLAALTRILRQSLSQFDAEQVISPLGKKDCGVPGSSTDFQQVGISC